MIVYKGMPIRRGDEVGSRIQGRQGNFLKSASVNLSDPGGYQTAGISTSEDPAVAFVYACMYKNAKMTGDGAIYAIWIDQGPFYRGIDVRDVSGAPAGNAGQSVQQQSIINQREHVLQSVASHQIIGWYTVTGENVSQLNIWVPQPHWKMFSFAPAIVAQAESDIRGRVNQKFPNGLNQQDMAANILLLAGPQPGAQF